MTTSLSDLPLLVDRGAPEPLAMQISAQIRAAVAAGTLRTGDRLPATRDLAATLGVSRTVVTNAYARLFAEGWLEGRHGSGTYVADVTPTPAGPAGADGAGDGVPGTAAAAGIAAEQVTAADLIDLRPGISWAAGIDAAAWRRAWRQAGTRTPALWPDPHGLPELREQAAGYLRRSRGLAVTAAHVLITEGVSSGLTLLAQAVVRPGDRVGVEEPGYPTAREVLRRAGAQVVACRVDAHGLIPEELPGDLRLLYTTPAHQYPLGGRLPVGRRQALIAWARATGAIIAEDDYDSEFRYDVGPLPTLYSMDPEVIVYLGTVSKALATALGVGWLAAAPALVERLAALRSLLGARIPEPVQHAMVALLGSGDLERHVRKMRLEYARRRAVLVDTLSGSGAGRPPAQGPGRGRRQGPGPLPGQGRRQGPGPEPVPFRLLGDTAGMHVVLALPDGFPAADLVAAAAARGVVVFPLDRYFAGEPTLSGLILGYGAATRSQVRRAATALAPLLTRVS